jgi:hypothetical protein
MFVPQISGEHPDVEERCSMEHRRVEQNDSVWHRFRITPRGPMAMADEGQVDGWACQPQG